LSLNRNEKAAVVEGVAAQAARSQTLTLAEYRGLTVENLNKLRVEARAKGVYLHVLKNSLARRAVAGTPFEVAQGAMVGPLIYGFSEDAVGAAKVMADFAKVNDKLIIKGGAFAGKTLDVEGVKALASIPSRPGGWPVEVADPAHGRRARGRGRKDGRVRRRARRGDPRLSATASPIQTFNRFRGTPNGIRQRRFPVRDGQHDRDGTQ
jgi:large subunit ribosomal protein L10